MKHIVLSLIALISFNCGEALSKSVCRCDYSEGRRLYTSSHRNVEFRDATVTGEDYKRPLGASHNIDLNSRRIRDDIQSLNDNNCASEQVHVTLGNYADSIIVSYSSFLLNTTSKVEFSSSLDELFGLGDHHTPSVANGTTFAYSNLLYVVSRLLDPSTGEPTETEKEVLALQSTTSWAYDKDTGEPFSNYFNFTSVQLGEPPSNNPLLYYDSPLIFQVELTGLESGTKYYYRVGGSCEIHEFVMPRVPLPGYHEDDPIYPFVVALTADVGQTNVSIASFAAIKAMDPSVVLLAGDLSYADGWIHRWDSFGRAVENLASSIPLLTAGGNHEFANGENWMSYYSRFPTPYGASGSPNPCYWGREVGVMNVISLCSYAGFSKTSLQYQWLSMYLENSIDRSLTPWLVVMLHVPFYSSNSGHWKEGELMRLSIEPLLYKYGVDIVLAGHVHSYERTHPVFDGIVNECGPTYINLGDGGNYEGMYTEWRFDRPAWSAFREASFGVGKLSVINSTHAVYSWHRHACGSDDPESDGVNFDDQCVTPGDNSSFSVLNSDVAYITRPAASTCNNRHLSTSSGSSLKFSTAAQDTAGSSSSNTTSSESNCSEHSSAGMTTALTTMIVLFALSAMGNIFTVGYVVHERSKRLGGGNSSLFGTMTSHGGRATGIMGQRRRSYRSAPLMDDSTHEGDGILLRNARRSDSIENYNEAEANVPETIAQHNGTESAV